MVVCVSEHVLVVETLPCRFGRRLGCAAHCRGSPALTARHAEMYRG